MGHSSYICICKIQIMGPSCSKMQTDLKGMSHLIFIQWSPIDYMSVSTASNASSAHCLVFMVHCATS